MAGTRRRWHMAGLALCATTVLALWAVGHAEPEHTSGITWHKDLDAARRLAHREGRPLFLIFRCEP